MDNKISRQMEVKTKTDETARLLQMRAAAAFKAGEFAGMLRLDSVAQQTRRAVQSDFFEVGLASAQRENSAQHQQMPRPLPPPATPAPRRTFKVAG